MKVALESHNPNWALEFAKVKSTLETIFSSVPIISINHVGSTSVPNLVAKPILDIAIVVLPLNLVAASAALVAAGYTACGELGIPDRWFFRQPQWAKDSYVLASGAMKQNTSVTVEGSMSLRNHLDVKRVLLEDEGLRDEYSKTKRDVVESKGEEGIEVDEYCVRKTGTIVKILRKAGWNEEVSLSTQLQKESLEWFEIGKWSLLYLPIFSAYVKVTFAMLMSKTGLGSGKKVERIRVIWLLPASCLAE